MRVRGGTKAPALRKRHVPGYYTTPIIGNMTAVSTKRGKFLGLLSLSRTDVHGVNYINFFFLWRRSPKWTILEVSRSPTTTHHTRNGFSITAHRRELWQHSTLTTEKYPYFRRDSNQHSQQAIGRRPTPQTVRPLGPAVNLILAII